MSQGQGISLSDFPKSASRSIVSSESHGESSNPNPFAHPADNLADNQPSQGYDPAASNLLANADENQYSQNPFAFHNWAWELAAWVLAAVSLLSLFVVLAHFNGKPLREWQSSITPSTVVAIVSQVGQSAAILPVSACVCQSMWLWLDKGSNLRGHHPRLTATQNFDHGSRGPLGSLLLLWKQPTSLLVWLGTVNTLLIVFFGAFAQQSLQLPIRKYNVNDRGPTYIPRCLHYQAGRTPVNIRSPISGDGPIGYELVPDLAVLAVKDGLLRKDISPSGVTGVCPTGNCTWPDYQSLGVCADVVDVSERITSNRRRQSESTRPAGRNYAVPDTKDTVGLKNGYFYDKPSFSGTILATGELRDTLWIGSQDTVNDQYQGTNKLIQFYTIYVRDLTTWDKHKDFTQDYKNELTALQVTLSLCVYTYRTSMTFGVTNTTTISKETNLDWIQDSETNDGVASNMISTTYGPERFSMGGFNQASWSDFFTFETFLGAAQFRSAKPGEEGGNFTENDSVRSVANSVYVDHAGIDGLSKLMDTLAVSLTNALRTTTDTPEDVPGTASSFEVYFNFQRTWMIVPIAAVILSLVFILMTIELSRRNKVPAWKSSLLALLLSLSSDLRRDIGGAKGTPVMQERAQGRNVRLEAKDGQWQIAYADQHP